MSCNINWAIYNLKKREMKNILLVSTVLFTLMFMSCNDAQKSELGHNEAEGVSKTNEGGEDAHGEEGHVKERKKVVTARKKALSNLQSNRPKP